MSGRKNRGAGKTILLMLYVLLFLSGLSLLLYPKLNAIWIDYMLHRDAAEFLSFVYTDTYIPGEDTSHVIIRNPKPTEPEETLPDEYPELWQQMRAYNEDIFRNGQEGLSGETAYEKPSFILADYGLESEVFAVLSIPKLDLEMPLYLGATKRHMADGAAHMSETSLPIGGINTNCVIAGHRGWNGAAYFLYIPSLEKGDIVTITNLWETLTYEVVDWKIITPYDVESIHIQPNRDLITLDGFINQTRNLWQEQGFFEARHCLPDRSPGYDYENQVVVVSPTFFSQKYRKPEYQLMLAEHGFGCSPTASGRKVYGKILQDGEKIVLNRQDIIGVIREECMPDWAKQRLEELTTPKQEQTMDTQSM